jgi:hypothetical protein
MEETSDVIRHPLYFGEGEDVSGAEFLFAAIRDTEFCTLYYGHNHLLVALNNDLELTATK